jgi:hypothetical protein
VDIMTAPYIVGEPASNANPLPVSGIVAIDQTAQAQTNNVTINGALDGTAITTVPVSANATELFNIDVSGYETVAMQLTGVFVGTVQFQASNDRVNWQVTNGCSAAGGLTVNMTTTGTYIVPAPAKYLRAVTTAFTSGTINSVAYLRTCPFDVLLSSIAVTLTNQSIALTASSSVGTATTQSKLISAATTNATLVKSSAARLFDFVLSNTSAAWKYVKFYNKASAPTVGTDTPVKTIGVPPGGTVSFSSAIGMAFATGLGFAITGAAADNDATAVAAGDVIVNVDYV